MIARVIQESGLRLPTDTFTCKHWDAFVKGDEAREQTKRIVHGYNYLIGKKKMSLILGVAEGVADTLMNIYDKLFPEIKLNYHSWIQNCLKKTRTIWTPAPVEYRKVFWDQINDDTYRQAYASYPQITVASMLNRTLRYCTSIFREDKDEKLKDQWCAYYGSNNWDRWRRLRDSNLRSPQAILWSGMDVRLNIHDAGGISTPDDADLVKWCAQTWKQKGEEPIFITKEDPLVIPVDFKKGPNWGQLEDYKIAA